MFIRYMSICLWNLEKNLNKNKIFGNYLTEFQQTRGVYLKSPETHKQGKTDRRFHGQIQGNLKQNINSGIYVKNTCSSQLNGRTYNKEILLTDKKNVIGLLNSWNRIFNY